MVITSLVGFRVKLLRLWRAAFALGIVIGRRHGLSTAFNENVALEKILAQWQHHEGNTQTYLQCILAREALVAVVARERLDSKMDPLVSLQIMISVETLWALVAFEWPVICCGLLMLGMSHEVWHSRCVSAIEAGHHARVHTYQCKLPIGVLDIRKHRRGAWGVLGRRTLILIWRLRWIV